MIAKRAFMVFVSLSICLSNLFGAALPASHAQGLQDLRADSLVLVNSASPDYADFVHSIQPYLDHFGIPYTILDIATTAIPANTGDYALIITGHSRLDVTQDFLDSTEEGYIASAVNGGTGIVSFDHDLSANGSTPRYAFIDSIFGFGYTPQLNAAGIQFPAAMDHYISQRHVPGEWISTGDMTLAGITLPADVQGLAFSGSSPFLAATTYGLGRAVQWGTYDWMSHTVKGPVYGLDDLVWRSLVWAARKPFVMQGLPPLVTMRMDDTSGPLEWMHIANEVGFIPWAGVFVDDIDPAEAVELAGLINSGKATVGLHAFSTNNFLYFDHARGSDYSDASLASNFAAASNWLMANNIPLSKYALGHYYELGSNVFEELQAWGVEYIGTMMDPGQPESSGSWIMNGPFRLFEAGSARDLNRPVTYSDYVQIPNHPELNNTFFNCVTEFRDIDGYEWHPQPDTNESIFQGTRWMTRAFDGMDLATLFTHEYDLGDINMDQWRTIMQGIAQNIGPYNPLYVSLDEACRYLRAIHNADITGSTYNTDTNQVTTTFGGAADIPTRFYVFADSGGSIQQWMVDVPAFTGSIQVPFTVPGQPHHVTVMPNPATTVTGGTVQFTAQGYDENNNLIPDMIFGWNVANGGGTIDPQGLFTAGLTAGTYPDTVVASNGTVRGYATVTIYETTIDHFAIDPISTPQVTGQTFTVTIRAQDASNNPVTSYAGSAVLSEPTGTVQPATTGAFTNGVWTGAVTIANPASGVILTATDGVFTGASNPFEVVAPGACPCTIWDDSATPQQPAITDWIPIEVGVKFRAETDGYLTGLRFYKGSQNTGSHTGHLWSADGTLLATVSFTNESASGWQTASLSEPVAITANTTYIASYYSPSGYFANDSDYFTSAVVASPLKALANGEDGPNGVYNYGSSGFPTSNYAGHSPNYWVDVVFVGSTGPDTTPPTITGVTPAEGTSGAAIRANATVTFSEAIDPASLSGSTFELREGANLVPAAVSYDPATRTATLDPAADLAYASAYTARVAGGAAGVKDLAGNPLAGDYSWTFYTTTPPPSDEGPGGPILVIADASNPFSRYYAEILRAEGLNLFRITDLSTVTPLVLDNYEVVILGEMALTPAQVTMFTSWVTSGGNLIAMRPDPQLADLLGLSPAGGTISNAYLLFDTTRSPGQGLVDQTIQFHGAADLYQLNGAVSLASLYSDAGTATIYPAVTLREVGTSSGQAAAFTFDLARSVIYTRQGNPAWAGQERDNLWPIRSNDLFFGNNPADPQPDWVDLNKVAIPQADEEQRFLANLIGLVNLDKKPLPHFWYLPRGEKAAVVMTGDGHPGNPAARFNQHLASSPAGCSVDDWECVRSSVYLFVYNGLSDAEAAQYTAQGFEVGLHVDTGCEDYTPESLSSTFDSQLARWQFIFPSIPAPNTQRLHCVVWSDWASQADIELSHNIRLDTNYYYWPPEWAQDRPGFFTGSGMPMRFADLDGSVIDVYQAVTQMTDESGQSYPYTIDTLLDRASGPEGYYGVFTANMHVDYASHPGADAIVTSALSRGVPIVSAKQMLTWLDGRNSSSFTNLAWNGNVLSFGIAIGAGANGLQTLVPAQSAAGGLTGITRNGSPVSYTIETLKGVQYAAFLGGTGDYAASYGPGVENTPPVALNDSYTTDEDVPLMVMVPGVLGNDTDAENNPLAASLISGPAHGNLNWTPDGSFTYTPAAHFNGIDTFTYQAQDGLSSSNTATVTISVLPVNYAPVSAADHYTISEDTPLIVPAPGVLGNDTEADGDPMTAILTAGPSSGELTLSADGSFTYTPQANYSGAVSFTYQASDGSTSSEIATVTIDVSPVNDLPAAAADHYATEEDNPLAVAVPGVVENDFDPDGDPLSVILVDGPTQGALTFNSDGSFNYNPMANYAGIDSFTYQASDGTSNSNPATVTLTVNPVNDPPVASDDGYTMSGNTTLSVAVPGLLANDLDAEGDLLAALPVSGPVNGSLTLNADGSFSYAPAANFSGTDTFTYLARDGSSDSNLATVTITVAGVNRAPTASDDSYTLTEDINFTIPAPGILENDADPDGDPLRAALLTGPAHGELALSENGSFSYSPALDYSGQDSFTYQLSDGALTSIAATVYLTVTPVNDAPAASNDSYTMAEDMLLSIPAPGVLTNDLDAEGNTLSAELVTGPASGSLILSANGSFTYAPAANTSGVITFTYRVRDGASSSNNATVTITVTPVNDPPVAVNDPSYATIQGGVLTVTAPGVLGNDTDLEGGSLSAALSAGPSNGLLTLNPDGSFTYTPNNSFSGTDSFAYRASDGEGVSNEATVTIAVQSDLIFADGFESGSLSAWSSSATDSGDLSASTASALAGSYGMRAVIDNNTAIYVTDDTPNAEPRYRARFYFDPNSIVMSNNNAFYLFYGYSGTSTVVLRLEMRYYSRSYQVRAALINDSGAWSTTSYYTLSNAPHALEFNWQRSSAPGGNNGRLTFWIDGVQRANLTGIDNDTRQIDRVRLGAISGVDNGTRGTAFFDAFESRRSIYIGP